MGGKEVELISKRPKIGITANPNLVTKRTVFLTHYYKRGVLRESLLHIEGHAHYGQVKNNYLNTSFLYRDDFHGAESLLGCIWQIELPNRNIEFFDLGGNLKRHTCNKHSEEGEFYIPSYWHICPVCYVPANAKFGSS